MTRAEDAAVGVRGTGSAPDRVFRTELNPVDFLHRAAYMYPDKLRHLSPVRRATDELAGRARSISAAVDVIS